MRNAGRYGLHGVLLRLVLWTGMGVLLLPLAPALAQNVAAGPGQSLFDLLQSRLVETLNWIDGLGAIAPVAFILLYLVITVAFIPASIVTLGAGVVFGVVQGTVLVFVGAMLRATAAFLVGRYLARDWVAGRIAHSPKFQAIDDAIGREGRKIIFLIRLSPAFPFNLLNYALGLTQVPLKDYVLGTVGIVPGTVLYVYLGSLLGNLAMLGAGGEPDPQAATAQWALRIIGLLATLAITIYITRIARKALREAVPNEEASGASGS
ncbi:MAG: TVP38/TMEM64 family protein [Cyanobacteria bacterium Co-bin8]|nr:TVP38/TMEM64 family protein [Cyanobacteria bacterium Co-bin8]